MSEQVQKKKSEARYEERHAKYEAGQDAEQQEKARKAGELATKQIADIDGLLDEIDLVLEENELVVENYIQKGGE